jgi:hypothetical protein
MENGCAFTLIFAGSIIFLKSLEPRPNFSTLTSMLSDGFGVAAQVGQTEVHAGGSKYSSCYCLESPHLVQGNRRFDQESAATKFPPGKRGTRGWRLD